MKKRSPRSNNRVSVTQGEGIEVGEDVVRPGKKKKDYAIELTNSRETKKTQKEEGIGESIFCNGIVKDRVPTMKKVKSSRPARTKGRNEWNYLIIEKREENEVESFRDWF